MYNGFIFIDEDPQATEKDLISVWHVSFLTPMGAIPLGISSLFYQELIIMYKEYYSRFVELIEQLSRTQNIYKCFDDYCYFHSIAIRNTVDLRDREERERLFIEKATKYGVENMTIMSKLCALTTDALSVKRCDFLGSIFMELGLGNANTGQFFTSSEVCNLMARVILANQLDVIRSQKFIQIQEPCIGAGSMPIAMMDYLYNNGINYQKKVHVTAYDVDLLVLRMAYIQLSLLGVPATLVHGNSLTLQDWDVWYTPMHIFFGWNRKLNSIS